MLENLLKYDVILASGSPRRRELLTQMGVHFRVMELSGVAETYPGHTPLNEVAEYLAHIKSCAYEPMDNQVLITADTTVIADNRILGKPHSEDEAREMLRRLSGRTHSVVTGVEVTRGKAGQSFSDEARVTFIDLDDGMIDYYVSKFRPLDKAGAYGIQEWIGLVGVERIEGSFYTVMGLPVHMLFRSLRNL